MEKLQGQITYLLNCNVMHKKYKIRLLKFLNEMYVINIIKGVPSRTTQFHF
jgi:hypothetical protein